MTSARQQSARQQSARQQSARQLKADLIEGVKSVSADDLFDPSRNPWLKGRQLWLQVIVGT